MLVVVNQTLAWDGKCRRTAAWCSLPA